MKKAYEKPQFLVENFALTQQIAKCDSVRISSTSSACVLRDGDSSPEMKQIAANGGFIDCRMVISQQLGDGLCYFTNMHMVFAST